MKTITTFWNYFQQNNFVFLLLTEIPQDELKIQFDKLLYYLHQYNKDLNLIIKNKKTNAELINPYLFKEVELLVHHAPKIKRWTTTAFLQPEMNIEKYENGTDKPLNYCGFSIRISEIYFIPLRNPNKPTDLGIKVLLKNYIVHKDNPRLREAVYIHVEHLIGEKSFANDIAFIQIAQLEGDQEHIIELYNLKSFIDIETKINFRQQTQFTAKA